MNKQDPAVGQEGKNPAMEKEATAYITGLMKMLHSKETSKDVVAMLKSGAPELVIPKTALTINKQMEEAVTARGQKPSLEVLLNAGVYLVNDLIEIGNAAQIFSIQGEEAMAPILQETMQTYIQAGLKDKSIDPIELQQAVEPLMDDEQKAAGLEGAKAGGIPEAPNQMTAMEQYASKRQQNGMLKGGNS
jgi:hypothetical protein